MQPVSVALAPGERLRYWRELLGLTQAQLAARAEVDETKVSKIENGKQQLRAAEAEVFAAALGLTMGEFYGEARAS